MILGAGLLNYRYQLIFENRGNRKFETELQVAQK
jgi:hypothetical protein